MGSYFDKYDRHGAVHWNATNWLRLKYNAPLVSRYSTLIKEIPPEAKKILDIGCGDGYLASRIALSFPSATVVGVDQETAGVRIAREKCAGIHNVQFMVSAGEGLEFEDQSFDVVVLADVIEHLGNPDRMVGEIARVLSREGTAIITTPNRQDGSKWDPRHDHEYTGNELKLALSAHFANVKMIGSWPMSAVRQWRAKGAGRLYLDVLARAGFNHFDKEMIDPSVDYGQLTAVVSGPRAASQIH